MTNTKAPREFWLCDHGQWYDNEDVAYEEQSQSALTHVIEHSAYLEVCERLETVNSTNRLKQMTIIELQQQRDELRKENEQYKAHLELFEESIRHSFKVREDTLQAKCAGLREALEFYAEGQHLEMPDFKNNLTETVVIDDGKMAREALEKFK